MKTRFSVLFNLFMNVILLFFYPALALQSVKTIVEIKPQHWRVHLSQLSDEERASLTAYLKIMLRASEGGYVLFGVKPVCLEAIPAIDSSPRGNFCFRSNGILKHAEVERGLDALNKLQIFALDAPVAIVRYDHADAPYDCKHMIWIHRAAFLNIVNQNLPLFQSILGPEMNADLLFNRLRNPGASFSSTLGNNKILIGIVLGFGTQNAIFASRLEVIDIVLRQQERPPLAKRSFRAGITPLQTIGENQPLGGGMPIVGGEVEPSIGFASLAAERDALQSQLELSTKIADRSSPSIPVFHCLRDNKETDLLLRRYREATTKIKAILDSDAFLEETISHLLGDKVRPFSLKLPLNPIATSQTIESMLKDERTGKEMADYIGRIIWDNLLEHDMNYVSAFIFGMRAADKESRRSTSSDSAEDFARIQPIRDFILATRVNDARRNVAEGDASLRSVAQSSGIHEIVPLKLYYRTLKSGQEPKLTVNNDSIRMQYMLSYLTGQKAGFPIASSVSIESKIGELIPGLAHAIFGMQQGEIREIYIHSDYAYGCQSYFEPGVALTARVELLRVGRVSAEPNFPALVPVDQGVSDLALAVEGEALNRLCQQAAHAEGYSAWSFYRLGNDLYSLEDVAQSLQRRAGGAEAAIPMERDPILANLIPLLYQRLSAVDTYAEP